MAKTSPMVGLKRNAIGAQGPAEDGNFVKLFVGCVPKTVQEKDVRPLFSKQGNVLEVALVKDKRTGQQQGCCFIKYSTIEEAERAIRALHNQYTIPGGTGPIQVRYADGECERLGTVENKLFVRSLNKQASEREIEEIFAPYGNVEDVYILKDEQKLSKGCAFVKFTHREMAMEAKHDLNGTYVMKGCDAPLIVQFAYPKRPRAGDRVGPTFGGSGFGSRLQGPAGVRSVSGQAWHIGGSGHGLQLNWHPMVAGNMGSVSPQLALPYVNNLTARGGPFPLGRSMASLGGPMNCPNQGSVSIPVQMGGPGMVTQQQGSQAPPVVWSTQVYGQQLPSQQPLQVQQQLSCPVLQEHQPQQSLTSNTQPQLSQELLQQQSKFMQCTQPFTQQQVICGSLPASQHVAHVQMPVSESQVQQVAAPTLQHGPSLQQQCFSIHAIHQQVQPWSQQLVLQTIEQQQSEMQTQEFPVLKPFQQQPLAHQPNYQLQQNLSSQQHHLSKSHSLQQQHLPICGIEKQQSKHRLLFQPVQQEQSQIKSQQQPFPFQFHFQSQQVALQQQHQQLQMQSAPQSQQQPRSTEPQQQQVTYQMTLVEQPPQQSSWAVSIPLQAAVAISSAPASMALSMVTAPVVAADVWTEHTSQEGYKYYYNSVTRESTWQKPKELTACEDQKQPLLPRVQQAELQPKSQAKQPQAQLQPQQQEAQIQQRAMTMPYGGPAVVTHLQAIQGVPTGQDWTLKGGPAGR